MIGPENEKKKGLMILLYKPAIGSYNTNLASDDVLRQCFGLKTWLSKLNGATVLTGTNWRTTS